MDLVALARRAVAEQQQTTERHTLHLEAPSTALVGDWDGRRLERVLSNLLDNAVKYSPDGGQVVVSVQREGDWAVVVVRDRGVGIPEDDLPHVFERFRRGANVTGRIGGTGIGLAGVRAIVDGHGGTVHVDSQEGVGSTFTVRLLVEGHAADPGR
jgi:signal transduction histidine kinase